MLGKNHATSGLLVGLLTAQVAPVDGLAGAVAWSAVVGGAALLPDLDQPQSRVGRLWGLPTQVLGTLVGLLAGGHRKGTHDPLLAPVIFGLLAWAGQAYYWSALLVLALAVGLALVALDPVIPGKQLPNLVVSIAVAWWAIGSNASVDWLPWAVALGVIVHILGDALTVSGVPVPLDAVFRTGRSWGFRLFKTGSGVEAVVGAMLWLVTGITAGWLYLTPGSW